MISNIKILCKVLGVKKNGYFNDERIQVSLINNKMAGWFPLRPKVRECPKIQIKKDSSFLESSEHETGFEPATLALARRYSTTEPLVRNKDILAEK